MVNNYLVQLQKRFKEFIFPLKNHTQSTEPGVKYIATCSETGGSEEDYSTLVSLGSTNIEPINCDILKQV